MAVGVRMQRMGIRDWGLGRLGIWDLGFGISDLLATGHWPLATFFSSFPVNFPTAKYPPFVSTSYVTGPCKMTFAPVL